MTAGGGTEGTLLPMQRYLLVLLVVGVTNCTEPPAWPCAVYDPVDEQVLSSGHITGATCQLDQQIRLAPGEPVMACWTDGITGIRRCQPGTLDPSRRVVSGLSTNKAEW